MHLLGAAATPLTAKHASRRSAAARFEWSKFIYACKLTNRQTLDALSHTLRLLGQALRDGQPVPWVVLELVSHPWCVG